MTNRFFLFVAFIMIIAWVFGCSNSPETSQKIDAAIPKDTEQKETSASDSFPDGTTIVLFTSSKHYFNEKEPEIRQQLVEFINSGNHNVKSVETYYSSGYLTAAKAVVLSGRGPGNELRVMPIVSDRYYLNEKDSELKAGLTTAQKNLDGRIVRIQTTFQQGYLVAAEVWYK